MFPPINPSTLDSSSWRSASRVRIHSMYTGNPRADSKTSPVQTRSSSPCFKHSCKSPPVGRSVSFEFHSSFLNSLIPLSYHLASLEEMNVSLSDNHVRDPLSDSEYYEIDGTNLSVMLCSAPQLRRFIQWGGPPLHPIFEHLTEYSLQYDVACGLHALAFLRHILMVSHRLKELTIRRNAFLPNESLPQGNVIPLSLTLPYVGCIPTILSS